MDIVSDANGVSFNRFQIAAWTVVLGIVFISRVYRELAMPTFSDTLLGLMGISAGTYLGLKIPEQTPPKA
jgi:ABC-type Mn2+/Zn2+ transport system permease subunit